MPTVPRTQIRIKTDGHVESYDEVIRDIEGLVEYEIETEHTAIVTVEKVRKDYVREQVVEHPDIKWGARPPKTDESDDEGSDTEDSNSEGLVEKIKDKLGVN